MKKQICLFLAACMLFALAACGAERPAQQKEEGQESSLPSESAEWSRQGCYTDDHEYTLSITWMDDVDDPGWYVGFMNGEDWSEDSYGGMLQPEGNTLHGSLPSGGEKEAVTVTVSEEGEDGLLLVTEGGETYHFTPMELPEATIIVTVNVEGLGNIAYAEGESAPEIDPEYPSQSAQINLAEAATHTFAAWPDAGNRFVKWTKNGEDFSDDPQITVLLDESADYVAVFEEDPDWQNPVMNYVGEYQCDRAHAVVECFDSEDAWITIEWGGSAWDLARWSIVGRLDAETQTIEYSGCVKSLVTYDENGELIGEETEYEDGTGTIVFLEDGTFIWHEDQSAYDTDMVFEPLPAE